MVEKVKKFLPVGVAVVVLSVIVVICINLFMRPQAIKLPESHHTKELPEVSFRNDEWFYSPELEGNLTPNDFGVKSGSKYFFVGAPTSLEYFNVLAADGDMILVESVSKSFQALLYLAEDGQCYIQEILFCTNLVQTTRGLSVGMDLAEGKNHIGQNYFDYRNSYAVVSYADYVMELRLDHRNVITEIIIKTNNI